MNSAESNLSSFSERVISLISSIPPGQVSTYGAIALAAGRPRGAREVARLLHSSTERYNLPWHRVVNRLGRISLPPQHGCAEQRRLLEAEGVLFDDNDTVNLELFLWNGSQLK